MAEGPQVHLRTAWLRRHLLNKTVHLTSHRDDLQDGCDRVSGGRVSDVTCCGKHIFIDFGGDILHNHLLMSGRWRKYPGGMLLQPEDAWITIDAGEYTVCNLKGQILEWVSPGEKERIVAALGPDAMRQPYPRAQIEDTICRSSLSISELLIDQKQIAGIGNIARSEILFTARIDPRKLASSLSQAERKRLHEQIGAVLWASHDSGGRWLTRVYKHRGDPCRVCGTPIAMIRLSPSRRSTYFCPTCQSADHLTLF